MDKKVCIVGCARNIGWCIEKSLKVMESIRQQFHKDSVIIVAENDSTDNTRNILRASSVTLLEYNNLDETYKGISERLAFVRNELMKYIHSNYADYDLIIHLDMDTVCHTVDPVAIAEASTNQSFKWDAIFANNGIDKKIEKYYDVWALRSKHLGMMIDCWDGFTHETHEGVPAQQAYKKFIREFQKPLTTELPYIPVESAFGGLGIYKLASTVGCTYVGRTTECSLQKVDSDKLGCFEYTCEHVSFHRGIIAKGGKLFIQTNLLTCPQYNHTEEVFVDEVYFHNEEYDKPYRVQYTLSTMIIYTPKCEYRYQGSLDIQRGIFDIPALGKGFINSSTIDFDSGFKLCKDIRETLIWMGDIQYLSPVLVRSFIPLYKNVILYLPAMNPAIMTALRCDLCDINDHYGCKYSLFTDIRDIMECISIFEKYDLNIQDSVLLQHIPTLHNVGMLTIRSSIDTFHSIQERVGHWMELHESFRNYCPSNMDEFIVYVPSDVGEHRCTYKIV